LFAERKILPLHLDQEIYLENDLLRKIDLATSYASIEGRVPFLDPDIISASRNFYDTFNLSPMLKPTLKSVLAEYLPHEMVYRGKSGLGLQVKKIFAESKEFKKDLYEALAYLVQQKCFDGLLPEDSVEELIEKEPNYAFLLLTYFYTIINTK
jgi:asparagine synthase (glutamine-hydrolysing)